MKVTEKGIVQRCSTRDGFRVLLKNDRRNVIAKFDKTPEPKPRVKMLIEVTGTFQSEGRDTIVLSGCHLP